MQRRNGMFSLILKSRIFLFSMTAALFAAPAPFRLLAPDSVWTKAHIPVFIWQSSGGADQYDVWVDTVKIAMGVTQTYLTSPQQLADGRHTWFVKATGGGATVTSADTGVFNIGTPPVHLWDFTDGFERGDLNDYVFHGIGITTSALDGSHSASYASPADTMVMHYAYNPAFINTQEAEASVLLSLDDGNADVGVGFADENGVWCYAMIDRANKSINIERRAAYSIFPHTESGFTKTNWTERRENGFYIWCSDTQPLPALTQGTKYILKFQLSNRLPSLGKAAQAIVETADSTVVCSVRSFLDDVYAPHPMFIIKNGNARVDDFRYQLLDRWSYNWKPHIGCLNPTWAGFNPAVWRDANNKWWLTARTDNKIRWSSRRYQLVDPDRECATGEHHGSRDFWDARRSLERWSDVSCIVQRLLLRFRANLLFHRPLKRQLDLVGPAPGIDVVRTRARCSRYQRLADPRLHSLRRKRIPVRQHPRRRHRAWRQHHDEIVK